MNLAIMDEYIEMYENYYENYEFPLDDDEEEEE